MKGGSTIAKIQQREVFVSGCYENRAHATHASHGIQVPQYSHARFVTVTHPSGHAPFSRQAHFFTQFVLRKSAFSNRAKCRHTIRGQLMVPPGRIDLRDQLLIG